MRHGRGLLPLWRLEPDITFLNHGSYGATPREVAEEAARWRARLEAQPVRFFNDELPDALRQAAAELARFVGTAPARLAFVENASDGVNAVLRSIPFRPGDEILTTSHVYAAVRNTLKFVAATTGAVAVEAPLPFPISSPEDVTRAVERALTPRTRLLLIDHIASASAVVMPVEALVALAKANGVPVLIDGAHGPGMLDLDVDRIGADWYVGNCHKWLCAPKGAAFIAVAQRPGHHIHPTVISHAYGQGFTAEFDKIGTRDHAPWLAVPAAIEFHERLGGAALRARNIALARRGARDLAAALGSVTGAPDEMTGAIATVRLPWSGPTDWATARALRLRLWESRRIELLVTSLAGALWARLSIAAYNDETDLEPLADALGAVLTDARDHA